MGLGPCGCTQPCGTASIWTVWSRGHASASTQGFAAAGAGSRHCADPCPSHCQLARIPRCCLNVALGKSHVPCSTCCPTVQISSWAAARRWGCVVAQSCIWVPVRSQGATADSHVHWCPENPNSALLYSG